MYVVTPALCTVNMTLTFLSVPTELAAGHRVTCRRGGVGGGQSKASEVHYSDYRIAQFYISRVNWLNGNTPV